MPTSIPDFMVVGEKGIGPHTFLLLIRFSKRANTVATVSECNLVCET